MLITLLKPRVGNTLLGSTWRGRAVVRGPNSAGGYGTLRASDGEPLQALHDGDVQIESRRGLLTPPSSSHTRRQRERSRSPHCRSPPDGHLSEWTRILGFVAVTQWAQPGNRPVARSPSLVAVDAPRLACVLREHHADSGGGHQHFAASTVWQTITTSRRAWWSSPTSSPLDASTASATITGAGESLPQNSPPASSPWPRCRPA